MFKNYLGGKYTLTRKKYTDAYPRPYIISKIKEFKPMNEIPFSKADKGYIAYKLYKIGKEMDMKIEGPEKKQRENKIQEIKEQKQPTIVEEPEQKQPTKIADKDVEQYLNNMWDAKGVPMPTHDYKGQPYENDSDREDDNHLDVQYQDIHTVNNQPVQIPFKKRELILSFD